MNRTKTYASTTESKRPYINLKKKKSEKRLNTRMREMNRGGYMNAYSGKYGLGGFLKKLAPTAVGAATSMIPGAGTFLAPVTAGITNNLLNNEEQEIQQEQQDMPKGKGSLGNYAKGGYPSKMNNAKAFSFTGNSHANGGIKMGDAEVEGNETTDNIRGKRYIFSDRLTVPNSKKTFAQRHKELVEAGATKPAIDALEKMQERVSGRESAPSGKEMALGGYFDPTTPDFSKFDINDKSMPIASTGYNPNSYSPVNMNKVPYGNRSGSSFAKPQGSKLNLNFDKTTALQLAPDLVNAATGIFGKDKTPPPTKVPKTQIKRSYKGYNINPLLESNRAGYRSILGDRGASTTNKLMAQTMKQKADSSAFAEKENRDQQANMSYDMAQGRLDARSTGMQAQFDNQHRQDKMISDANLGITGNFARNSFANIANKLLMMEKEGNMSARDQELLAMYRKIYGGI